MTQPTPTPLLKAKLKTASVAAAAMAVTGAMTLGVTAAPEVLASRDHAIAMAQMQAEVELAASIGVYPSGPLFQAARMAGLGSPDAMLNTLQNLAGLIGQDGVATTIGVVRTFLAEAQNGINLPIIGDVGLPEMGVPSFGPAGIIDSTAGLEGSGLTGGLLSAVKTLLILARNADNVPLGPVADALDFVGQDALAGLVRAIEPYAGLIAKLPLNVPGEEYSTNLGGLLDLGVFTSSADKFSVIPTWGLGGTNAALASSEFLKMKDTAILVIALRNTSRPGGGIAALLNPFSQLVGLDLANADGRGNPEAIKDIFGNRIGTKYDGNLTTWDITAAYDLLSDAPSTIYNPVSWLNSGVGFAMPTYLIPASITDLLDGDILAGLTGLLGSMHFDVSNTDGNLYVTYDSGNLPLLEPFQFLPRTVSYLDGFDISTPVSSSLDQVLRTIVATGYQDVGVTDDDGDGVYEFVRGWDMGGTQARFWESPIGFTEGAELPQTVFNELIAGLQGNLLNPSGNELELFGNNTLTNLLYNNDLAIPVAKFISDALQEVRNSLNPLFNEAQGALKPVTQALDSAANEIKTVIDGGLKAGAENPIVDLSGPMLEVNRFVNRVTEPLDNGIPNAIGNLFNGNSTASTGLFSALRGAEDNAGARTVAGADANVLKLPTADVLGNVDLGKDAKKVADALKNPTAGLKDFGDKAEARVKTQLGKVKGNLAAEKTRADRLVGAVKSGNPEKVVTTVRDNVKERATQVKKDLNDGVAKVKTNVDKGAEKAGLKKKDVA